MKKRILAILFVLLMSLSLSFTALEAQDVQRLYDDADILTASEEREYRILSNGLGAAAISMDDIDYIGDYNSYELSEGYYADAFHLFIDECEYEINGEINDFPFEFGINLCISLVIGLVVALIVTGIMRLKLKFVAMQLAATEYVKSGSMHLTVSNDLFLYRTIHRRKKESNTSRASGSSRNVGGGKF
ncbi:MAG: hypothetical protein IJE49_00110 [Agathobacter sp.]|nr:hypothetical protein [Agathobacter sp.]